MMNFFRASLVGSTAIASIMAASTAYAQVNKTAEPAAAISQDTQADIIVTANKREENINKVGASITAFSGNTLAARNIVRPEELARTVPGLALAPSTHGTPVYTIRGVGYNGDALSVYPAVSLSLDQAPLTFPVLAGHVMYDLERVEVLKGPQGTLFGQNSTGGAINYVAAKPTPTFQAGLNLDYARFNEVHGSGYVSGPLSDTVGIRVAFDADHRDGWQYSSTRDAKNGKQNYAAGRVILGWQPSDKLKVELNVNGSIDRSQPQALQMIASLPTNPAAPSIPELTAPLAQNKLRAADWSTDDARPRGNRKLFQAFLRADYEISGDIALTSITSYSHLKQNMSFDLDGSSFNLVDAPIDNGKIDDFNQELRFSNASNPGALFRWTVGASYNYSNLSEFQTITYRDNSLNTAANLFINSTGVIGKNSINTYAGFGNTEYDLSSRLTLKAGVRYTKSMNKDYTCVTGTGDGHVYQLFNILGQILGGQNIPLGPDSCISLDANNLPGTPFRQTLSEDNVSWKGGLDYKLSPDTLLYGNVSRGFKAGSFPVITVSLLSQLRPAKQESVTAYEVGLKTKLLDNMVQVNLAAFYQKYRNKQVQGTNRSELFGLLQELQNVPKSHIYGAEGDIVVRPAHGLTLSGSASYLKTKVDSYTALSAFGVQTNFAGERLPFAPSLTLIGDLDYRISMASGAEISMGASVNYRSYQDAYVGGSNLAVPDNGVNRSISTYPYKIDGYALFDARLGYQFPNKQMSISIFGKNIFNKFYVTNEISYNDIITRTTGQPATYGISFKVEFK